jgi:hypothetical protein
LKSGSRTNVANSVNGFLQSTTLQMRKSETESISLRARGNAIQSHSGKAIPLLTSTGIGSIPFVGPIAGILAGVVHTFFLETGFIRQLIVGRLDGVLWRILKWRIGAWNPVQFYAKRQSLHETLISWGQSAP